MNNQKQTFQKMAKYKYTLSYEKGFCPDCGRNQLSLYTDVKTGQQINPKVGKCSSCSYHYPPRKYFIEKYYSQPKATKIKGMEHNHQVPLATIPDYAQKETNQVGESASTRNGGIDETTTVQCLNDQSDNLEITQQKRVIIHEVQLPYLRFKHDHDGVNKWFVSLCGKKVTFYFSITEFESHYALHHGQYTHYSFENFEKALVLYEYCMLHYDWLHTISELKLEYLNQKNSSHSLTMW